MGISNSGDFWLFFVLGVVLLLLLFLVFRSSKKTTISNESENKFQDLQSKFDQLQLTLARTQERLVWTQEELARQQQLHQSDLERWKSDLAEGQERYLQSERDLQSLKAYFDAQKQQLFQQKEDIVQVRKQFNAEFETLATRIFDEKSKKFVDTNTQNLDQILNPLKDRIKNFEEKVEKSYQHEAAERNTLKGVVEQLMEQSRHIKNEANSLTRALRGDSKKQGNWGEVVLERVLERSGLRKDSEYRMQVNLKDEEGKRNIPDAIILLPEGKHLVVDSKVSLLAYESWTVAEDEKEKEIFAKEHVASVLQHIRSLASKNYASLYELDSPDFVLLFMPIESAFSLALEQQSDIFSEAWEKKVVLVSPTTLLATLRTIASIWKQEKQTRNALEIAREAGALYDKFVGFVGDLEKVGLEIDQAKKAHTEAFKKLSEGQGNAMRRIQNLKELGAKTTKQIDSKYLD